MSNLIASTFQKEDVIIFYLQGSLEIGKQAKLKEELARQVPIDTTQVVLDFSGVEFIDSACLGALIGFSRNLRQKKGDVRLSSLKDDVQSILKITRLDKIFPVYNTTDEAVASYK